MDADDFRADVEEAKGELERAEQWGSWLRLLTLGLFDNGRRITEARRRYQECCSQLNEYEALLGEARELDGLLLETVELDGVRISKYTFADVPVLERARYPVDWDELRQEVLTRDGHECQEPDGACSGPLQIHHRVPLSRGGNNKLGNLVTLCFYHHSLKHPHMREGYDGNLRC
ncbi:HNH endonuclease [Planctomycetota bacterium]